MRRLSELCNLPTWQVVNDATIYSFGFVESALNNRLIFAESRETLALALKADGVSAVLTKPEFASAVMASGRGLLVAEQPRRLFVDAHNWIATNTDFYGAPAPTLIDPLANVAASAHVDSVGVVIGPGSRIEARAVILQGTEIGANVVVQPGAVLGGAGFQCMRFADAVIDCIHVGKLRIGDRCVVMANAVVAKAVFRQHTIIGADSRVGNNAFVSHNCQIGTRCLIGHGAVVAGNCVIGDRVTVGPGAVCADRIVIGDGATITMGAVVTTHVAGETRVTGNFAVLHEQFKNIMKTAMDEHDTRGKL